MKKILSFILALVAIATTASADKYDIWVGGVQVTDANKSNVTGGDIKSGTVTYTHADGILTLKDVTITRSGKGKQGIRCSVRRGVTIRLEGTNTITTDNSCALRVDENTWLYSTAGSTTTFTEKQQEAIYVTGGSTFGISGPEVVSGAIIVNSTSEYAIEGEKGTEIVVFGSSSVTLNGKKGSLVKLGKVNFAERTYKYKMTSVTLKATNNSSYPQVQNVAAWVENGYNHIDAPIGGSCTHPAFISSSKTIIKPEGLSGDLTSYDIVINEDVVQLNSTYFPDANFLTEVKKLYSSNQNGYPNRGFYSKAMAKAVTTLDVTNKSISDLTGIEHFTELTALGCGANKLKTLNVSANTKLTKLICSINQLTSLDVTSNSKLTTLECSNNQLTTLSVPTRTTYTYPLASLDCSNNQLTELALTGAPKLKKVDCSNNQLTKFGVTPNATNLKEIKCYYNKLTGQGVKNFVKTLPTVTNGSLDALVIDSQEGNVFYDTEVETAKSKGWNVYAGATGGTGWGTFSGYPTGIEINATNFPDTNFRSFVSGATIDKNKNGYLSDAEIANVTVIDVSNKKIANLKGIEFFTALTNLRCYNNQLTSLDVSKNTALTSLSCEDNQLTSLNVSGCTALEYLDCSGNQLTSLNVSGCTALEKLDCYVNQLTSLNVSGCTALTKLYCYSNQIKGDKMQALVNSLPKVSSGNLYVINTKDNNEGNVITKPQVAIAKNKGWKVYDRNGGSAVEYAGSDDTPTGLTAVESGQLTVDSWYSIDGKKLQGEPTKKGVYIIKGKKVKK